MAFGINKDELSHWKKKVKEGKEIAFLTHFWMDPRFPNSYSVTKVGCSNIEKLIAWGKEYQLKAEWIHYDEKYPHFDLFGRKQEEILKNEGKWDHIYRFKI